MRKQSVIVAPHPDDEVIGCWEVLKKSKYSTILYVEDIANERMEDAKKISDYFSVCGFIFFKGDYRNLEDKIEKMSRPRFYFPDPYFESHPSHRVIGAIGEKFLRKGFDVIFYSTNMQAPYIHEVKEPEEKEWDLDNIYTSERSLWKYEHKYFLFEGYCKWML